MNVRLVGAAGLAVAAALSVTAHAGPATLDGKKVRAISATFTPTVQDNDKDFVALSGPERVDCDAKRCGKLPFVFAPAKGTRGSVGIVLTWGVPVEDLDLYLAQVDKRGNLVEIANCGASAGTSEKIVVSGLKAGKYAVVVDYYRSAGGKATATVSYPAGFALKSSVPAAVETASGLHVNCALS